MGQTMHIDTLAFQKKLKEAGADERIADAIVEGLSNMDTSELCTKKDLKAAEEKINKKIVDVKQDIAGVRSELQQGIAGLRSELQQDIAGVRSELKQDNAEVKVDILKWMFGAIIAQTGVILAVLKLL